MNLLQALGQPLTAPGQHDMGPKYWPGDTSDPLAILAQSEGVNIQEKLKGMEMLTGFETGNSYTIRDLKTGCHLFLAMENKDGLMGAFTRNALTGSARPYNLKLGMLKGADQAPERFALVERPYQCTCCCLNRPEASIRDPKTNSVTGKITEPFSPCMIHLVLSSNGQDSAQVKKPCTALCCFGPCCPDVEMPIEQIPDGTVLATIHRHYTAAKAIGALTGVSVDADNFTVKFNQGMSPQQKLEAIATALVMDFAYFTKGGGQQNTVASDLGGKDGGLLGMALGAVAAAVVDQTEDKKMVDW